MSGWGHLISSFLPPWIWVISFELSYAHCHVVMTVGVLCFDSLENQKTRQHQNQYLELQDLVLFLSERDLSSYLFLQRFTLCALSIGFRLVIKCRCLFVCLVELIQQNMKGLGKVGRKRKY